MNLIVFSLISVAAFALTAEAKCAVEPITLPGGTYQCPTSMPFDMETRCCESASAKRSATLPVSCATDPVTLPGGGKLCANPTVYNPEMDCCMVKSESRGNRKRRTKSRRAKRETGQVNCTHQPIVLPGRKFCANNAVYNLEHDCCTSEIQVSAKEKRDRKVASKWAQKYRHLRN